jgi:hypothetical protein
VLILNMLALVDLVTKSALNKFARHARLGMPLGVTTELF